MWAIWCALIVLAGCLGFSVNWLWFAARLNDKDRLLRCAANVLRIRDEEARMPPNAVLIARARQHGPVYHEDPSGSLVRLHGVEDLGSLWPEDV